MIRCPGWGGKERAGTGHWADLGPERPYNKEKLRPVPRCGEPGLGGNTALMPQPQAYRPLVIAHRGASGIAPENTLLAVATAITLGADMAEVDLQLSRDGHLVLFHDPALGRTTHVAGPHCLAGSRRRPAVRLADLTLEEIKTLDAGSWFAPAFAGLAIPTLIELLEHCAGRLGLNLELKVSGTGPSTQAREQMAGELCRLVRTYPAPESLLISSLDHQILASVRERDPRLRLGLLLEGKQGQTEVKAALRMANTLQAYSLHLPARLARPAVLAAVQQEGYRVSVYTVNQPSAMRRMIAGKVDGIMTDYPDRLTALLDRSRSPRP